MTTDTVVLPAFLSSALVNGDTSGLESNELHWVEKAVQYCAPGRVVGCIDESWHGHYADLPGWAEDAIMSLFVVHYD
jgi:hypothetical protein